MSASHLAKPGGLRTPDSYVPFLKCEIEQSLPDRLEQQARRWPYQTAVKAHRSASYAELELDGKPGCTQSLSVREGNQPWQF
jgi:hypothetical protein